MSKLKMKASNHDSLLVSDDFRQRSDSMGSSSGRSRHA